jgi:uncharacterized protein YukE
VGKGGFDYDPEAVRSFAEVFNQAKSQVEQLKGRLANSTAKADDFGNSWGSEGAEFERHMQAIAEDLTNLAAGLGNIHANLMQGTDLVVHADTNAYQNMNKIEVDLGLGTPPPGAGGH